MPSSSLSKQNFVFVTSVNSTRLSSKDQRRIRQKSQLSRWAEAEQNGKLNLSVPVASSSASSASKTNDAAAAASSSSTSSSTPRSFAAVRHNRGPVVFVDWQNDAPGQDPAADAKRRQRARKDFLILEQNASTAAKHKDDFSPSTFLDKLDPFETRPFGSNPVINEILWLYVNDPGPPINEPHIRQLSLTKRRDYWLPMVINDPAAYYALLAFLFSLPRRLPRFHNDDFVRKCTAAALMHLRDRLMKHDVQDATVFAVGMLEFTAWLTDDKVARLNHHNGFVAIMAERNKMTLDNVGYARSFRKDAIENPIDEESERYFKEMYDVGVISRDPTASFRWLKAREDFTTLAARDGMAGQFVLNHAPLMTDPSPIPKGNSRADQLYHACQATITITGRMVYNETGFRNETVEKNIQRVHLVLFESPEFEQELAKLWKIFPSVLLWLGVINGTATLDPVRRSNFRWLLAQSKRTMKIYDWEAMCEFMTKNFRWPGALNRLCENFWLSTTLSCSEPTISQQTGKLEFGSPAQAKYFSFLHNRQNAFSDYYELHAGSDDDEGSSPKPLYQGLDAYASRMEEIGLQHWVCTPDTSSNFSDSLPIRNTPSTNASSPFDE